MTLAAFNGQVQDLQGNALPNINVEVRRAVPGQPRPQLFADPDGTEPLGNPFALDPDDDGHFRFHVRGGTYNVRAFDGNGFEKTWEYVAIGTAAGFDVGGDEGEEIEPFPLVQNVDAGYALRFETETSAPPGAGAIRFNHADLSQATEAYVSAENAAGSDISERILELFDAQRTVKDVILLTNAYQRKQASFQVDGVAADGSPATYFTLDVSQHSGETTFPGEAINLQRERAGVDGADGADGADGEVLGPENSIAGQFAVFADNTGKVIEGGDLGDSPSTPITLGDDAAVRAATKGQLIHSGHLQSASTPVALADGPTVAINWTAGINFTLTVAANRTLGNPTNEIPGTWRTVLVQGNSATDRTLIFGNEYGGEVPTLEDIDNTKKYLLMIYCKAAGEFLVTAMDGSDA